MNTDSAKQKAKAGPKAIKASPTSKSEPNSTPPKNLVLMAAGALAGLLLLSIGIYFAVSSGGDKPVFPRLSDPHNSPNQQGGMAAVPSATRTAAIHSAAFSFTKSSYFVPITIGLVVSFLAIVGLVVGLVLYKNVSTSGVISPEDPKDDEPTKNTGSLFWYGAGFVMLVFVVGTIIYCCTRTKSDPKPPATGKKALVGKTGGAVKPGGTVKLGGTGGPGGATVKPGGATVKPGGAEGKKAFTGATGKLGGAGKEIAIPKEFDDDEEEELDDEDEEEVFVPETAPPTAFEKMVSEFSVLPDSQQGCCAWLKKVAAAMMNKKMHFKWLLSPSKPLQSVTIKGVKVHYVEDETLAVTNARILAGNTKNILIGMSQDGHASECKAGSHEEECEFKWITLNDLMAGNCPAEDFSHVVELVKGIFYGVLRQGAKE